MINTREMKSGATLAYVLMLCNALYGLFLTPYIVGTVGQAEYGVYKTISALSSSVMVLDMGMGSTIMRYVARYRAFREEEKIPNLLAMICVQAAIVIAVVAAVCAGLYSQLDRIYAAGLTGEELLLAKRLFLVLSAGILLHIAENLVNGMITGYNRFTFGNGIKVLRLLARVLLLVIFLRVYQSAMTLVCVDVIVTLVFLAVEIIYLRARLHVRIRLEHWERPLFRETFRYTVLMFITAVISQVNSNLDNVVIGALDGSASVAVYSIGLLLFEMFGNVSTSISGVMLPTVTEILRDDPKYEKIYRFVVRTGRIQFLLLGAVLVGFICIGRDFIHIWLGDGYRDVYLIAIILMAPAMLELVVNVCLSILRAQNLLAFRTGVLAATTCLNAVITYFGVKYWSYYAAALGTALSYILGSVVVMNLYYHKKFGFPILKMFREIFSGIWLCLLLAGGALFAAAQFLHGSYGAVLLDIGVFCAVYAAALMLFGLRPEERRAVLRRNRHGGTDSRDTDGT